MSRDATALIEQAQARASAAGTHGTTLLCIASMLMTELSDVAVQAGEVTERSAVISGQGARTAEVTAEMRGLIAEARTLYTALEQSSNGLRSVQNELAQIARETHIVALNALIEAARVGDLGAPFAVVAKEVQALAKKAGEASRSIEERAGGIRTNIADGAAIMGRLDDGVVQVDVAAGVVAEAARTQHAMLERLGAGVSNVSSGLDDAVNGAMSDLTEEAMTLQGELADLAGMVESMGRAADTATAAASQFDAPPAASLPAAAPVTTAIAA